MGTLKAGFARRVITPPLGAPITGYLHKRYSKGVLDDLYASAVAFSDGDNCAIIMGVDLIDFPLAVASEYRKIISDYCNVPVEAIFLNCSHTHTGPAVGFQGATEEYKAFVGVQLRDVAAMAIEDLKSAKIAIAEGTATGISFIRRYRMKNGGVQTNPGVENPEIDHALGTPNEAVKLVKIERDGGDDIYLVNFGVHADTVGGELVSRDYPGFVVDTIEKTLDGVKAIYLTAPQGDVNHINPFPKPGDRNGLEYDSFDGVPRGYEHAKHMGRVIAGAILQICGKAEYLPEGKLSFAKRIMKLPTYQQNERLEEAKKLVELYDNGRENELPFEKMELTTAVAEARRIIGLENGPDFIEFTIGAISIGDVVFCAVPGEMFTDLGIRICDQSSYKMTLLCCLTNGGQTYFPTRKAYEEGGYEARASKLKPGADDIIVNDVMKLFETVK